MNKKTNVIFLAVSVVGIAFFFMYKTCNFQKENLSLSEKYDMLEKKAENLKSSISKSNETVTLQKEYIDKLLSIIRRNKSKIDTASKDELAELEEKYNNLSGAYKDLASGDSEIGSIEGFNKFAEERNKRQGDEIESYKNLTRILRDSIRNNIALISSLNSRIDNLTSIIQSKDVQINNLSNTINTLNNDIARYSKEHNAQLEKMSRERKEELERIVESGKKEKEILSAQNDSLKNDRNNLNERNKKLEAQVPNATPLSVKYVNTRGELVELRGSNNKKSNKNIEEIFVNFSVNTEKYKGDVKFELTLRCVECKNPSKCPNIPILDREPITVISKEKIWSECKQPFKLALSRYCKYKIIVNHGSENVFTDDYIFITDGYDK